MRRRVNVYQRGDTIVEVLIAIAIVSSVLGITYATMNRSLLLMRDNEERTAATKHAQSQIESIKAIWNQDESRITGPTSSGSGICVTGDTVHSLPSGVPSNDASGFNPAQYRAECTNGIYRMGARYDDASGRLFVAVYWDSLASGQINQVTYYYKFR